VLDEFKALAPERSCPDLKKEDPECKFARSG